MGLRFGRSAPALLALAVVDLALVAGAMLPASAAQPYAPPDAGSLEELDLGLARLGQHRRLLLIGAHPDDESGVLLAHVNFGLGGEATYLSLSRGEGGQNRLGPELGPALGLLRSAELLAARQIDHAAQLFTRAIDFGYGRSFAEALDRWPEEELLRDVVRAIRLVRPQVVVAVFPPSAEARHAQHQLSGHLARLGFSLAGDPAAFPELAEEGLPPHAPERLLQLAWWDGATPTFTVEMAALTASGRSVAQLGRASRSRHRSQDMGSLEELGAAPLPVEWVAGGDEAPAGLFDGVDTRLVGIAAGLEEPLRPQVEALLENVELLVEEARAGLAPSRRGAAASLLAEIVETLLAVERRLSLEPAAPAVERAGRLLDDKRQLAEELLASAAGVVFDARTTDDEVVAGEVLAVELELWNAGAEGVVLPEVPLVLWSPAGWSPLAGLSFGHDPELRRVAPGELLRQTAELRIAAAAAPSVPYYLRRPPIGDLYDWSLATAEERGRPFGPPPLLARLTVEVAGSTVRLERPVVSRRRDRELGELRRPLRLVPAIEVEVAPERLLFRRGDEATRELLVTLRSHSSTAFAGVLETAVPPGWPSIAPRPVVLAPGERALLQLPLSPPLEGAGRGSSLPLEDPEPFAPPASSGLVSVVARGSNGDIFDLALRAIDYPHIVPQAMPRRAEVAVGQLELALPELGAIGYVRGGADAIPEALAEVGLAVELLDRHALLDGDLARFDAIVVGGVAYETEPALAEANPRLESWVRAGGLLLVQYQRRPFFSAGWGLLPMALDDDPDRATDETTAAAVLHPERPLWHRPNPIGESDWQGWVQERGLYFPSRWDASFEPQVAFTGALGEEVRGGLLVAPLGRGLYVYTGLAFFRQLPAGVPGAFRLFANLLALAAEVPAEAVDSGT